MSRRYRVAASRRAAGRESDSHKSVILSKQRNAVVRGRYSKADSITLAAGRCMRMENDAPERNHWPTLDGLRGLAIILVFLFHALAVSFASDHLAWSGWHRAWPLPVSFFALLPAYLGWSGVAIFFVVSGFCIHWSHTRSRETGWRTFFVRRFFRIYPPFLVALLAFTFLVPGARLAFNSRHDVDQLLTHLLLVHNDLGPGFVYGINPAFWSIGTEVQLYLLYPLLLFLVKWGGWRGALLLIGGIEMLLRLTWGELNSSTLGLWLIENPLMYGLSWSLGAALADNLIHRGHLPLGHIPLWIFPMLALGAYFLRPLEGLGFLLWALATATILARILAGNAPIWTRFLSNGWLRWIGTISYSVYLLHQPLVGWAAQKMRPVLDGNPWRIYLGCMLSGLGILLLAWIFYLFIERPSIALGKFFLKKRNVAAGMPHSVVVKRA